MEVCFVGCGLCTALGFGYKANLKRLLAEKDGLRPLQRLKSIHQGKYTVGEINCTDEALLQNFDRLPQNHITRTALLGALALKEITDQLPSDFFSQVNWAFINASTGGGMSTVEDYYSQLLEPELPPDLIPVVEAMDCAESTNQILQLLQLKPQYKTTVSTACSSSANAILIGARLLQQGLVKAVVCGGSDAFSRFTFNGFISLKNVDKEKCLPFDANRNGLNLGEGAGYVLMTTRENAQQYNLPVLATLSGYANCNDTYHQTAPSPDGLAAINAMSSALKKAHLLPGQINYINAHGTATDNNDSSELLAISQLFSPDVAYSSTKSFIGHTLAAAGAIEAIYSLMSVVENKIWPNLRWKNPMLESAVYPVTKVRDAPVEHALSNSFGFGGNNVSLLISKAVK